MPFDTVSYVMGANSVDGGGSGGVTDHKDLAGRSAANQHPISAITGLQSALDAKADADDIPAEVTESTVSGWGFTKNTGTYSKPSGGIPKTDLASAVQDSLDLADSALQEHQDISGKLDSTNVSHETWIFTLENDTTVTKEVCLWTSRE